MITPGFEGLSASTADVCVIGAGPVGISLALELDRLGLSVLLLESGRDGASPEAQALSAAEIAEPAVHDDMSIAVSRQLGGTSNLWGGFCVPYDPVDFRARQNVDATWPIAYEDLAPYYERACVYTGAGDPVFESPVPGVDAKDDTFTFDTIERSAAVPKLQVAHRRALAAQSGIDVRTSATVVGFQFREDGSVRAVDVVRPDGTEKTTVAVRHVVIAAGGLESTRLLLSAQRRFPDRFGGPDGPLGRYYMGHVIGDIADIEFSDGGLASAFDYFIDGHGSYVRRRFVPSEQTQMREGILNSAMWPIVPPVANAGHESAILSSIYLALAFEPLGKRLVADAIRKRHIPPHAVDVGRHAKNILTGVPSAVAFTANFFWHRYLSSPRIPGFFIRNSQRRYPLAYHSEQVPRPESRVVLTDMRDATGLEKLRIDLRFHDADAQSVVRTHELLACWLDRTGLGKLHWHTAGDERTGDVLRQAQHGTHQIGTARMGHSVSNGVVDADLKVFDTHNLHVASTAVLPTSGQANPTLTAVALAMRLAHFLKHSLSAS